MAQIAPIFFAPQTPLQSPVNTASGAGSDLSFGALLEKTVSSGAADAQQAAAKPAPSQKIITAQTETDKSGVDSPPAQSEPTSIKPDAPAIDLNAGILDRNNAILDLNTGVDEGFPTISSPPGSMPEQPLDSERKQPSLVRIGGNVELNQPPVTGFENVAAILGAESQPASPLTSTESQTEERQVVSVRTLFATPAVITESETADPAGFPPRAGIQADPELFSQLPATGQKLMPGDTAASTLPALSDSAVPAPEPESLITPISSEETVSAHPPRDLIPPAPTDPPTTGVLQSNRTALDAVALPMISQTQVTPAAESEALPASLEKAPIPGPVLTSVTSSVFTSVTGTVPDSAGSAGLQQNPSSANAAIWPAGGQITGRTDISSGYSVNIQASAPSADTGRGSIISAQLLELVSANETGNLTITRQTAQGDPLEHLARLTPPLQVSPLAASATDSARIIAPQSEMTPLIASFNQLTSLKTPVDQPSEKASPALQESLRQEVKGQFVEARIETRDKGADNQGQQPGQQSLATDAKLLATPLAAAGTGEQSTAFFPLHQTAMSQTLPQHTAVTPAPVAPPPGAPVADDFIFNQVAERFHLQTRNQETQLNIKLHPAELGELKIDLTMKDGSIRAHIVAQSGQVQEVLEKNMVRLKSILEGQGFSIEEILVSIKTEDSSNFDPQQDQLSRGNTAARQSGKQNDATFEDTYERVAAAAAGSATGVNITA